MLTKPWLDEDESYFNGSYWQEMRGLLWDTLKWVAQTLLILGTVWYVATQVAERL